MANVFPGLAGSAIGITSKTPSSQQQTMLLEQTKTLAESAVQLLYNAQEAGGNRKVVKHYYSINIISRRCESAYFKHKPNHNVLE